MNQKKFKKKVIKFVKGFPPYMIGETAGFAEEIAADLVRKGVAVETDITPEYRQGRKHEANGEVEAQLKGENEQKKRDKRKVLDDA